MSQQNVAYLLGAYWYGNEPENQLPRFLREGVWENGYEDKYLQLVQSIPVGATVLVKASYYDRGRRQPVLSVRARGIVTANPGDGRKLSVAWEPSFQQYLIPQSDLPGIGRYRDTVEKVSEPSHLARLLGGVVVPPPVSVTTPPLNQILYGPPGTGKTYSTAALAVGILENLTEAEVYAEYTDRKELQARYQMYREQGQAEFVTFHQAFGYEDFVEGIKPYELPDNKVGYRTEDGVFKRLSRTARQAWLAARAGQTGPVALQLAAGDFDELYERFADDLRQQLAQGVQPRIETRQQKPVGITAVDDDGTLSMLHLNSGNHLHRVGPKWIRQIYEQYASPDDIIHVYNELRLLGGPNASLQWAIFNALKKFEQQSQSLPLADLPAALPAQPAPRFVLVIDEINRGNVANIFGELITLLETDKRSGELDELLVTLPYSKQSFTVPPNLYLLGTMNTADRSVEALDTALRRRFSFTEMQPDAQIIRENVGTDGVMGDGADAVDVARLLEALNSRLEQLLDRDHCLGHALLLPATTLAGLRAAFARSIVPLLQEYFFGDWGKIGLVLGADFVEIVAPNDPQRYALAKFGKYDGDGPRAKPLYRLADVGSLPAAAFQRIYAPA